MKVSPALLSLPIVVESALRFGICRVLSDLVRSDVDPFITLPMFCEKKVEFVLGIPKDDSPAVLSGDDVWVNRLLLGELLDHRFAAGSSDRFEGCIY